MALVIFAHFCARTHHVPRCWFFDGWAVRSLQTIWQLLGAEWQDALRWPAKEMGLEKELFGHVFGEKIVDIPDQVAFPRPRKTYTLPEGFSVYHMLEIACPFTCRSFE